AVITCRRWIAETPRGRCSPPERSADADDGRPTTDDRRRTAEPGGPWSFVLRPSSFPRGPRRLHPAWAHLVRWAGRPPRLFPPGDRRPPAVGRRGDLRRPRRALPVPARAGEQPGRLRPRHRPGRPRRRPRRLARLYAALGDRHDTLRSR